jgi:hypothetical protein
LEHRRLDIGAVAALVLALAKAYQALVQGVTDEAKRNQFAPYIVNEFRKNKEMDGLNIVVVYQSIRFIVTGQEYEAETVSYKASDDIVVSYSVYTSLKGAAFTFTNQGDGGPKNWYYNGQFTRTGNTITASRYDYEVITYRDANFGGSLNSRARLSMGQYDAKNGDIPNDSISSIYVPKRFIAFAYEDSGLQGQGWFLPQGRYSALPNGNDKISSVEVMYIPDQTGLNPG